VYKAHNADYIKLDITESQPYKGFVLARIAGIDNMDAAIAAKNTLLFAERDDLPKADGAHFIADLLGLSVYNAESGEKYGEISNIINRGASDIYVIETGNGEVMLPAVAEYVKEVDPERGIFIPPIEGFFEN
jgi:16S rRNA processing protein RimM